MVDLPPPATTTRASPFLLASTTTARFVLLILAAVGASFFSFSSLYHDLRQDQAADVHARCAAAAESAPLSGQGALVSESRRLDSYLSCSASEERIHALFIVSGAGALLIAAGVTYWFLPALRIRRRRLEPIEAEEFPELVDHLNDLKARSGVTRHVSYLFAPDDSTLSGVAFGNLRRRYVALPAGLVAAYGRDRQLFDAVVAHEFAHLRNRDIDQTWLAIAIWWVFPAVAVVPLVVATLDEGGERMWSVAWRLLVLSAVVFGIRQGVLRTREYYADVRGSVVAGEPAMAHILSSASPGASWRRPLSVHPSPDDRRAVIAEPDRLMRLEPLAAFATGVVAMASVKNLEFLLLRLDEGLFDTAWVAALVFVPVVAGVLTLGSWQSALGEFAVGRPPQIVMAGASLAIGLWVGRHLSFDTALISAQLDLTEEFTVGWLVLVIAACILYVGWSLTCARLWISVLPSQVALRAAAWLGFLASGLVLAGSFGFLLTAVDFAAVLDFGLGEIAELDYEWVSGAYGVGPFWLWSLFWHPTWQWAAGQWFVFPVLLLVLCVPLSASLLAGRRDRKVDASWMLLPGSATQEGNPSPTPEIGRTLRLSLFAAAVCGVALIILRAGARLSIPEQERLAGDSNEAFLMAMGFWVWMLIAATQVLAALLALFRVRHYGVLLGLFAAVVSGTVAYWILRMLQELGRCVDPLALTPGKCGFDVGAVTGLTNLTTFVVPGALLALAVVAVAGSLTRALRKADRTTVSSRWAVLPAIVLPLVALGAVVLLNSGDGSVSARPTPQFEQADRYDLTMRIPQVREGYLHLLETTGVAAIRDRPDDLLVERGIQFCRQLDEEGNFRQISRDLLELSDADREVEIAILTVSVNVVCEQHLERYKSEGLFEEQVGGADEPLAPGLDPVLDGLWERCARGDDGACNELYWTSPLGSPYEEFAWACGGRSPLLAACIEQP